MTFELSDDLPGMGQFYCLDCARHFSDEKTLATHKLTKDHKRRLASPIFATGIESTAINNYTNICLYALICRLKDLAQK